MEHIFQTLRTENTLRKHLLDFTKKWQRRSEAVKPEPTVAALCEAFLQSKRGQIKESTWSTYSSILSCHILPQIGSLPLSSLTVENLRSLLRQEAEGAEVPLAASTVRGVVTVVRSLLAYAGEQGFSVPQGDSIPRPQKNQAETSILSEENQQRLKEYCMRETDFEKLGILICLYTGLRLGEICALKWGDISLESGTLRVSRTVQRIKSAESRPDGTGKTRVIFDHPKSRSSNRCIPLPGFLIEILKPFARDRECFVLTGVTGSFLEPRTYQNHYRKLLTLAGVRYVNFHALRHTFATNCVNLGFDPKTLSEILGHADVSITLNTYVHPSLSRMKQFMERLS